ncbi:GNAT family N-acetyltransferase [Jannaschia donghaensis]|uniref:Ribosomal-protein-alanine acetyltransferase n=1 Tax=Jannaschia donghaensis TaxID=420998 RepID=A0A0M6YKH5_9RHOB|nr:GNAT family N-acetyltransferase [Jannaschia donghaensis]CTQ49546.1 ribosomal-protein-alanine acetyltransferase [Jannaschia donghaensis]
MIRQATPGDREAISALHLASWQDSYGAELTAAYMTDELPAAMRKKWAARTFRAPELIIVAETDGVLQGFVCAIAHEPMPLIDNLHIRPDLRGQGLGTKLLRVVRDALWVEGHDRAYLTVLESNPDALAFYLANGGHDEGAVDDMLVGRPVRARRIGFDLQTRRAMG